MIDESAQNNDKGLPLPRTSLVHEVPRRQPYSRRRGRSSHKLAAGQVRCQRFSRAAQILDRIAGTAYADAVCSRDLLGHNVGHVIVHAQLTL